ncbi:MAG: HAMP domain-containing sensor histidine kinase [Candidatus Nealsonbacteria bacterium]|nr:HAMP domain-containing sensor histidine kinase [Candidatus Nealsonbacteria bacterium]
MNNIFLKAILFTKENLNIVYSLFLIILIPAAFFVNNYLINSNYEKNIDQITQRKAILVENIINNLIQGQLENTAALQSSADRIVQENKEIILLSILKSQDERGGFEIIVSSDSNLIGQKKDEEIQNILAWNQPEGIAFLDRNERGRFWKVTKSLSDNSNNKIGLIEMSFSLEDSDALINKTISNSYWILILTILVVVLFVANQARLLGYVSTVTKLKEIDKMKDMFISMASHELRSPLTAIKGYLDLIKSKKDLKLDKDSDHYITNILLSVDRLDNLVEDILEVSRIEGNRLPIEITAFNPDAIISQSIDEMRFQATQKNLKLNFKPFESVVQIKADKERLKQVLINLISNAIKYTEKGSIEVNTALKKGSFLITVADTGIGISSEDQSNIFQKFYRIKNKYTMDIIGTGLGLWITFEIIKRMQGKITLESIEGVGSHFTVHLPIVKK